MIATYPQTCLGRALNVEQAFLAHLRTTQATPEVIACHIVACEREVIARRDVQGAIARLYAIEVFCEDTSQCDFASRVVMNYFAQK